MSRPLLLASEKPAMILPCAGQPHSTLSSSSAAASALPAGSGRYLEIRYTALDFNAPEAIRFKYRLAGVDDEWIDAGPRRVAYYTNLRPGRYHFRVQATGKQGLRNENDATLAFTIQPFLRQTWWFRGSGLAGLLSGVVVFYRAHVRSIRERQRAEVTKSFHDRLAGKLSAIVKVADPESPAQKEGSKESLGRITQLAQAALRTLRQAISMNDPRADTLDGLVTQIIQDAEETLPPLRIGLRLDVPLEIPARPISPRVREEISLIASEAINNVVKHAQATTAWLRVRVQADEFVIEIEDDGGGFVLDLTDAGRERGLANMKTRAAAIRGRLEVHSAPGRGTTIRLTIPHL